MGCIVQPGGPNRAVQSKFHSGRNFTQVATRTANKQAAEVATTATKTNNQHSFAVSMCVVCVPGGFILLISSPLLTFRIICKCDAGRDQDQDRGYMYGDVACNI